MSGWLEFAKVVTPMLLELAGDLFARHKGDAAEASKEIKRIRDHGERYVSARVELQDELIRQQKAGG